MKRGKEEEKIMVPMFPRLHVNDTDKGGPRAPPRNKMALYEQLSIPSSQVMLQRNPNNAPNSTPPSSQGGGGMFFSRQMHPRYPSVNQRKQLDEDEDCSVPVFVQSVPTEFDNYSNNTNSNRTSLSNSTYMHPSLKFQQPKETSGVDRLRDNGSGQQELCQQSRFSSDTFKRNASYSQEYLTSENQNIVDDLSDDGSCGSLETGNLERDDSVSETSILDTVSSPDITPDDVVGIIGQKQFWNARRAIINQQRIFAVQVFELHRLMKVQKLISASPHLMLEDSALFDKPVVKPVPSKKRALDCSNDPKKKRELENRSDEKEVSGENTVDKASLSSLQNGSLDDPPAPLVNHNGSFNHPPPQAHQWLVPVMSPTEGLVYKPYPGTGCGPPMYGIAPPPHQYPMPSYPPFGPHGYFSPYGMPIMTTPVEQTNPPPVPPQNDVAVRNRRMSNAGKETDVQGSSASCLSERQTSRRASNGRRNMLPLFPTSPTADVGSSEVRVAEKPSRVIKVVPHNSMTASESAARIFQSIQEERKQSLPCCN